MRGTTKPRSLPIWIAVALVAGALAIQAPPAVAAPRCLNAKATIVGTGGDDVLRGTPDKDVIVARGGDDVVKGKGGKDILCGKGGADLLIGGGGRDRISGGALDDEIRGGSKGDRIFGDDGIDTVSGGGGNDRIVGGTGNDQLTGDTGDDRIEAEEGNDFLDGGDGTDFLDGGAGIDTCLNGEQNVNCEQEIPAPSGVIVVQPSKLEGWHERIITCDDSTPTGSIDFVGGPGTPPRGNGSVQFTIGANVQTTTQLRNVRYDGVRVANLTSLTYWTHTTHTNPSAAVPGLLLNVDTDNDGDGGDKLFFFQPAYQNGYTTQGSPPPQNLGQSPLQGVWQKWDALHGGWTFRNFEAGPSDNEGDPVRSMENLLSMFPNATIVNFTDAGGLVGGVRLDVGCSEPNIVSNADEFTIGVGGQTAIFDFEPD